MKLTMSIMVMFLAFELNAQSQQSTVDVIKKLEESRREASLSGDINALSDILAPEFYEIGRKGVFRTRDQNLNERRKGILKFDSLFMDSIDVKVFNDIAIVTGIVHGKGIFNNQPFEQPRMRYSRIYLYRKGKWQIIFGQNTDMVQN